MSQKTEQCAVCYKRTKEVCSHVGCPNRKPVSAAQPRDEDAVHSNVFHGSVGRRPRLSDEYGED